MPIMDAPAAPPEFTRRRSTGPTKSAIKAVAAQQEDRKQRRIDGMNSIGTTIQMFLLAGGQHADAGAVNRHAPNITTSIADYAEGDDEFGAKLDRLSDVTPIAGIVSASAPLLLQVMVNHSLFGFKAEQFASVGIVTPETLKAESATLLMRMQKQALDAQIQAEQEAIASARTLHEMRSQRMDDDV